MPALPITHSPALSACISSFNEHTQEAVISIDKPVGGIKRGHATPSETRGLAQLIDRVGAQSVTSTVVKVRKTVIKQGRLMILEIESPALH